MRIDAYNAISQIYKTNKTTTANKNKRVENTSDKFEISQAAKTYQVAKAAVEEAADVRTDKVAQIKAMMEAGTYRVSSAMIADKLIGGSDSIAF